MTASHLYEDLESETGLVETSMRRHAWSLNSITITNTVVSRLSTSTFFSSETVY